MRSLKCRITAEMRATGIQFTRAKSDKDASRIGIHLLLPDQRELERAIEEAEAKLFPAIIIHGFGTWPIGHTRNRGAK